MAFRVTNSPYTIGTDEADFIVAAVGRKIRSTGIVLAGDGDDVVLVGHGPVFTGLSGSLDDPALWTKAPASYVDAGSAAPHTSIAIEGDGQTIPTYTLDLARGQTITLDLDFTGDRFFGFGYRIDLLLDGEVVMSASSGPSDVGGDYGFGLDYGQTDPYLRYTAASAGEYQIVVSQIGFGQAPGPGSTSLLNVSVTGHAATGTATAAPQIVDGGAGDDIVYAGAGADVLNGGDGADVLNGGAGNDVLTGGGKLFVDTGVANFAYDSPLNLDDPTRWTTAPNPLLAGSGAHTSVVSVQPANATQEYDYYSVTVAAGETIRLDVDFASKPGDPLDLFLALFAPDGTNVAYNEDAARDRGSDASGRDPALTFTAAVAGTYTILVGREPGSGIPAGVSYLLNVGVTVHAATSDPVDPNQQRDVLTGGDGNDILVANGGAVDYSDAGAGVTVMLHANGYQDTIGAGRDLILEAVGVVGSRFADQLSIGDAVAGETPFLSGGGGDDILIGGSGDDLLAGGLGADTMTGGLGNDTYLVDSDEDVIVEEAGGGTDTVMTDVALVLGSNVENLTLNYGAIAGTGNAFDNVLTGASDSNVLSGLEGADILRGAEGDDVLQGGRGNDMLYGDSGRDLLIGGSGADRFVFANGDSAGNRADADEIRDFSHAEGDRILLRAIDADTSTAKDDNFIFIGGAAFTGVAGQLHALFDGGVSYVEGDTNGDGEADFTIIVAGTAPLVPGDILL